MDFEKYFDCSGINGRYQKAVASATALALKSFCEQEQEFEQAVEQSGKSFQECLDSVVKGVGLSISDTDLFRRAAEFYFPTATISFSMKIDLCGNTGCEQPPVQVTESRSFDVSLDSLLDF